MDPQATKPRETSLVGHLIVPGVLLACVAAPVALTVSAISDQGLTSQSLLAAAIAGGVCWLSATSALLVIYFGNQCGARVQSVLLAMLFRMALPLAALLALPPVAAPWVGGGLAPAILGTYLVTLTAETLLVVRSISMVPANRKLESTAHGAIH